jgi:DNA gyrase inhibitor GyrI
MMFQARLHSLREFGLSVMARRLLLSLVTLFIVGLMGQGDEALAKKYNEAQYKVVETLSDSVEIREYMPQLVADVTVTGDRKKAASKGFRQLFSYITGANNTQAKVAMTTPVAEIPVQTETDTLTSQNIAMTTPVTETLTEEGWVIRFFLPPEFTLENVPVPTNKNIVISEIDPHQVAVIRFSGRGNNANLNKRENELREMLTDSSYSTVGSAEYAFYNAPFTLPFLRRNEVMLPVSSK